MCCHSLSVNVDSTPYHSFSLSLRKQPWSSYVSWRIYARVQSWIIFRTSCLFGNVEHVEGSSMSFGETKFCNERKQWRNLMIGYWRKLQSFGKFRFEHSKKRLLTVKRFRSLLMDFLFKIGIRGNPLKVKVLSFQVLYHFTAKVFPLVWKWNHLSYEGSIISMLKVNKFYDMTYKKCTQAQLWQMPILNRSFSIIY